MIEDGEFEDSIELLIENTSPIGKEFLERDSITVARDLIGSIIVTSHPEGTTAGRIVETEAYPGDEPASHVFNKLQPTPRTAVQYASAGHLYMYLIMGLHHMTSIVTNQENIPDVVFIRSMEPFYGVELMRQRRNYLEKDLRNLTKGPGRLSQALGLNVSHHGFNIFSENSFISLYQPAKDEIKYKVEASRRINLGINKLSEENADIATNGLLRFYLSDSKFLS